MGELTCRLEARGPTTLESLELRPMFQLTLEPILPVQERIFWPAPERKCLDRGRTLQPTAEPANNAWIPRTVTAITIRPHVTPLIHTAPPRVTSSTSFPAKRATSRQTADTDATNTRHRSSPRGPTLFSRCAGTNRPKSSCRLRQISFSDLRCLTTPTTSSRPRHVTNLFIHSFVH